MARVVHSTQDAVLISQELAVNVVFLFGLFRVVFGWCCFCFFVFFVFVFFVCFLFQCALLHFDSHMDCVKVRSALSCGLPKRQHCMILTINFRQQLVERPGESHEGVGRKKIPTEPRRHLPSFLCWCVFCCFVVIWLSLGSY